MQWCVRRYAAARLLAGGTEEVRVLDIGGADVNGSYADLFRYPGVRYIGADLSAGPGVDLVLDDPYRLPLPDGSVDFVVSGQMLEHCEYFWQSFAEMIRVLKADGFLFMIVPSAGPIHRYPVDCYRFYPDAYRALAKWAGCHLIEVRHDQRGPWNDVVGVFSKAAQSAARPDPRFGLQSTPAFDGWGPDAHEKTAGARPYLDVLAELHAGLRPKAYLEIGVRNGDSLALASCPALGIDPVPDLKVPLPPSARVVTMNSDDFFEYEQAALTALAPDLVFIDGMHLFEFAMRDFIHVERLLGPRTVVVIDDVLPNHAAQASRDRRTRVWTGDVWRFLAALRRHRPDLGICVLNTAPSGLAVIAGLDVGQRVLWQQYNPLVRQAQEATGPPPEEVLERRGTIEPSGKPLARLIELLVAFRDGVSQDAASRALLLRRMGLLESSYATLPREPATPAVGPEAAESLQLDLELLLESARRAECRARGDAEALREEVTAIRESVAAGEAKLEQRDRRIEALLQEVTAIRESVAVRAAELDQRDRRIEALEAQTKLLRRTNEERLVRLGDLERRLQAANGELRHTRKEARHAEIALNRKTRDAEELAAKLKAMRSSRTWRVLTRLRRWVGRLAHRDGRANSTEAADMNLLEASGWFDRAWYTARYPDIQTRGIDPAEHYLRFGAVEGRDPGPKFSTNAYLKAYPDIRESNMNPLVHFLRHGQAAGRSAFPVNATPGRRAR